MKQLTIINKILKGLIFLSIFFLLAGITYSYFLADIKDAETGTTLTGEAGRLDITYDGGGSIITATGFGPKEATFATKTFTLKGNSNIEDSILGYKIILVVDENTFTENALSYTMISTKTTSNGEIAPSIETNRYLNTSDVELGTGYFTGTVTDAIHTYELKLYFLDTGVDQSIDMEKSIKIHITIENYLHPKLSEAILAQGGGTTAIEAKGTPSFSVINGTSGLYATEDEYGTSYYYRGLKTELNNNLIWGGFQWKIVRINGDGSIRLLYNGTEAQFTTNGTVNDTGEDTQIGYSAFNEINIDDAKYVGYMYGGANGSASSERFGTTSVSATYNQTDNTIKVVLDDWYKANIFDKGFGSQVADNLFCNDRQLQSEVGGGTTGPGYGNTETTTNYAARYRLVTTKIPTLKCGLQNDHFTTSVDAEVGNGDLTYPVGLLTADEAAMAGLVHVTDNSTNYLYTIRNWWSLSPYDMHSIGAAGMWRVDSAGYFTYGDVDSDYGVRPAVSIMSAIRVSGIGSATNPFRAL